MPITKSAKKALRQNVRRRKRNLARAKAMKAAIKAALKAPKDKQKEAVAAAYKVIDKAAKARVIAKNTATRQKSRLMKAIKKRSG